MRNIALRLAYDGTHFAGSQWQRNGRSVQGELEAAWFRLTQEPRRLVLAGRTDAGVHALGQVANVRTETHHPVAVVQRALNALLPPDVAVVEGWEAEADFHARLSAAWRWYRYLIDDAPVAVPLLRHMVWHAGRALDGAAMQAAMGVLPGTHDFAAFASVGPEQGTTVRCCFRAECRRVRWLGRSLLAVDLVANAFVRRMVRAVVGTLLLVGDGRMTPGEFAQVLASRERQRAGPTAAAHGLTLMAVGYTKGTYENLFAESC
ncbi:MAG: tRNA pseudouridine(38-40) synthase TruA [Chloroflexaceae bacterium]|nr:tRNA pseudouridine(38-40) synthase TruA [Chloroflexaceae bacterium]